MNSKQQTFLSILLLVSAFTLSRAEVTSNVDSLEFIDVPVGKSLKQHAILGNNGNERIDIQSAEIIGDDAEFFSTTYTEKLPRFIYPGNTPWMAVFFSPTEPGLFSAELILNLSDGTQLTYPLEAGTTDNNLGVELNVDEFDFGVVPIGEQEKLYGIFENLGTLRTDIVAASITGPDADLFSSTYVDKLPRFIYPGSTPWMPVFYQPTRDGQHRATLTLNLSDGSELLLPLSGGGNSQGGGELLLLTGNINFSDTLVTQSQSNIITVLNNGETGAPSATINNVQIQNNNFSVLTTLPLTLQAGESADLQVSFTPKIIGFQEDTLVLDTDSGQLSVQVTGTGIARPDAILLGSSQGKVRLDLGGQSDLFQGELAVIDPDNLGEVRGLISPDPGDIPRFVTDASENPQGTSKLFDAYNSPSPCNPDFGIVDGLAAHPNGTLYATLSLDANVPPQDQACMAVSGTKLATINPMGMMTSVFGDIVDQDGVSIRAVGGLAIHPLTGAMYLVTSFENATCARCLYSIDLSTQTATLIKEYALDDVPWAGGMTFTSAGELFIVNVAGPGFTGGLRELLEINPDTGDLLSREPILLEQQHEVASGISTRTLTTAGFQGLTINPDGEFIASWANGGTSIYKRVRGVIIDKFGNPIDNQEQWVWKNIGDSGNSFSEIEYLNQTNEAMQ